MHVYPLCHKQSLTRQQMACYYRVITVFAEFLPVLIKNPDSAQSNTETKPQSLRQDPLFKGLETKNDLEYNTT